MSKRYKLLVDYGKYKAGHIFEPGHGIELADNRFSMCMVEEIKEPSDEEKKIGALSDWIEDTFTSFKDQLITDSFIALALARALLPHMKESFFEEDKQDDFELIKASLVKSTEIVIEYATRSMSPDAYDKIESAINKLLSHYYYCRQREDQSKESV